MLNVNKLLKYFVVFALPW